MTRQRREPKAEQRQGRRFRHRIALRWNAIDADAMIDAGVEYQVTLGSATRTRQRGLEREADVAEPKRAKEQRVEVEGRLLARADREYEARTAVAGIRAR